MLKDIGFLFIAGTIVYDAVTGRVSGRGFDYYTRKEHPIFYWIMAPILMLVAALLLVLGLYDLYHRTFA